MECSAVRKLLSAAVDAELDVRESTEVDSHLQGCAACRAQFETERALRDAVRRDATYFRAPAALEARIRAALPATSVPHASVPRRPFWQWPIAVGALAALFAVAVDDRVVHDAARCRRAHRRRDRLEPRPVAARRPRGRRRLVRSAHGQAVVQRQARLFTAGARLRERGLSARRRPPRLHRSPRCRRARLPSRQAHDQRLRACPRPRARATRRRAPRRRTVSTRCAGRSDGMTFWAVSDVAAEDLMRLVALLRAA